MQLHAPERVRRKIQKHQSPSSGQNQAAENLHLIANVVKIIMQKTELALQLCVLDLVPECGTSFCGNAYRAVNSKPRFLQERVFSR